LTVKGIKSLYEAFKEYVVIETMDGDNKIDTGSPHGLQVGKKGVIFTELPPVLHLQLRRFEYDIEKDAMGKINDRFEFPFSIDLDEFVDPATERTQPFVYKLHGVLVHSGDLHGGHYFALIKPAKDERWLKFDDDRVTPVTDKEVTEDNFGGDMLNGLIPPQQRTQARTLKKFTNAYMLVYIRETELDSVLAPFEEGDTPPHLSEFLGLMRAC
jgi:ubiquitin carboxyl-terminal hydrolase 7